jgi:hypothetical protein
MRFNSREIINVVDQIYDVFTPGWAGTKEVDRRVSTILKGFQERLVHRAKRHYGTRNSRRPASKKKPSRRG